MKKTNSIILFAIAALIHAQPTTRFLVVSDMHHHSPAYKFEETLLYEFTQAAIREQVDFIFFTGDLVISGFNNSVEQDSVLKDWRFVLDTLRIHAIRVFACRGNNDVNRESWDALFSGENALPQNGPENEKNLTYAFEYDNLLFICLDQYVEAHRINQEWLDEQLSKNNKPHIFVAAHEPAFKLLHSNCMAAFPNERDIFWESLLQAGVKIFFCGHDHFYDRAIIDDGDGNAFNDLQQVIVGTGGHLHGDAEYDGDNGRWTPVRLFHVEENGYALIDILGDEATLIWKHRVAPQQFEDGGDSFHIISAVRGKLNAPSPSQLLQNYPNPCNSATVISYQLSAVSHVDLAIYNLIGQKVFTLVDGVQKAGCHRVRWDASGLASGMYLYRLEADEFVQTKKLILMR